MKDIINGLIERFRRQHVQARRYVAMMLVLALLTTLFVNWQLHGVGITMTADYHCGSTLEARCRSPLRKASVVRHRVSCTASSSTCSSSCASLEK